MAHPLPDQKQIEQEVSDLFREAREARQARPDSPSTVANTAVTGHIAPIYMGHSHDVIPERYVIHYSISVCANCQTESRDSEFYALSYLKSRVNGTRVRHLVRCDRPLFNLPVDVIPTGNHRVPFCCECPTIDLSHLPPPPQESLVTHTLPDPVLKGHKPREAKPATPAKRPPSLEDLI